VRFDEGRSFMAGLNALATALRADLDLLREHTRLLARPTEWQTGGRAPNRLLSGDDIGAAKAWAARRPKNAPELTPLHLDFIGADEEAEDARLSAARQQFSEIAAAHARTARLQRRAQWALSVIAALVAIGISVVYWQYKQNIALQRQTKHQQANLLDQLASIELLRGNIDSRLRFSAQGAQVDLAFPVGTITASAAAAQLATAVSHTDWHLIF
jgi:hypothetical protein